MARAAMGSVTKGRGPRRSRWRRARPPAGRRHRTPRTTSWGRAIRRWPTTPRTGGSRRPPCRRPPCASDVCSRTCASAWPVRTPGPRGSARPALHVVVRHPSPHGPHPAPSLRLGRGHRRHDGLLEALDVVGVADVRLVELVPGAGELRQDEGSAAVVPAGDVLLGHEVHAVAQRGHQQDVGREEERRHLVARVGVVQVVDGRRADVPELAVDPAHLGLHLLAQRAVGVDALAAGGRDLHEDLVGRGDRAVLEELRIGLETVPDALGVVEAVNAEQEGRGVAERLADLLGPLDHLRGLGEGLEPGEVHGDRDRARAHDPRSLPSIVATVSPLVVRPSSRRHARRKLCASATRWKPRKSAPSRPSSRRLRQGSCAKSSTGGKGMWLNQPIRTSGPQLAHHRRHELQLVVVHPDGGALGGDLADGLGEAPVHPLVGGPPVAVEGRRDDDVVVDRPQGVVAEALVVLADLVARERDRAQVHAVLVEGLGRLAGVSGPAHPGAGSLPPHHRLHGRDEAAGAAPSTSPSSRSPPCRRAGGSLR